MVAGITISIVCSLKIKVDLLCSNRFLMNYEIQTLICKRTFDNGTLYFDAQNSIIEECRRVEETYFNAFYSEAHKKTSDCDG